MKSSNIRSSKSLKHLMSEQLRKCLFTALAATLLLALTTVASFGANPGVLPIGSQPFGMSYGQWAVAWWQWALSIPAANSPMLDTTGAFAAVGQRGPVWFLGGSLGNSVERTLTVPAGKAIFAPVHPWIFGATVGDCTPSAPGVPCDVPTLRASAAYAATNAQILEVSIDSDPVRTVRKYRALSPSAFNVTLPDGNILGLPAGIYGPQVADGYWLMLQPLDDGRHTIRMHVVNPTAGSDYTIIYHVTVNGGDGDDESQTND